MQKIPIRMQPAALQGAADCIPHPQLTVAAKSSEAIGIAHGERNRASPIFLAMSAQQGPDKGGAG